MSTKRKPKAKKAPKWERAWGVKMVGKDMPWPLFLRERKGAEFIQSNQSYYKPNQFELVEIRWRVVK